MWLALQVVGGLACVVVGVYGCVVYMLTLYNGGTDMRLRHTVNLARQDMRSLRDAVLLLERRLPTAAKNIPVAIQSLNRRMDRAEAGIGSLCDNLRDAHNALTACEQRLASIVDTTEEVADTVLQDDSRSELVAAQAAAADATSDISPGAVCGNCGKTYKEHYHEDEDYCNDQTTGDVFTAEPSPDVLLDHFSRTHPEDFRQLAEAWRRASGH